MSTKYVACLHNLSCMLRAAVPRMPAYVEVLQGYGLQMARLYVWPTLANRCIVGRYLAYGGGCLTEEQHWVNINSDYVI